MAAVPSSKSESGWFVGATQSSRNEGSKTARQGSAVPALCKAVCGDRVLESCHTPITQGSLSCSRAAQHMGLNQPEDVPGNSAKLLSLLSSRSIYALLRTSEDSWDRGDLSVMVDATTGSA